MTGDDIKTVAIVGAGTMGPGMAATFARHGFETRLTDVKPEVLERGKGTVDVVYKTLIGGGFMSEAEAEAGRARLTFTGSTEEAVRGADFVLEAIPEKLEIKQSFFREIESLVGAEAILASNTSGIRITAIAEAVRHPERVVGMHWSNPPHMIPVIEVIKGERTGDAVVEATKRVVERIGMIPVLVQKDVPGFIENRILYAIMREGVDLVEKGVIDPEGLDTCVSWGIGYKLAVIGPMALLDMAGLDIYQAVGSYLNKDLCNRADVSPWVSERTAKGRLGMKTGGGIFSYTPERIAELRAERARRLVAVRKALES